MLIKLACKLAIIVKSAEGHKVQGLPDVSELWLRFLMVGKIPQSIKHTRLVLEE